jgi:outer membrane protein TolC
VSSTKQWTLVLSALAVVAGGCSADHYSKRAEDSALRLLRARDEAVLGEREAQTSYPAQRPAPPETVPGEGPAAPQESAPAPRVIDLRQALAIAYTSSRQMIDRREALHLQALSLAGTRHDFAPQLALALSYLFTDPADGLHQNTNLASFSASQILPTGASLTLDASSSKNESEDAGPEYGSLVSLSLVQPLLRGGGHAVAYEPLIQAERDLVYAIREFELFREDFSIDVARRFYDLVNRKQSIENQQHNLDNNEFGRRQAEALFAVGRGNELDVLRARRSELTAKNALLEAQESLHLAFDTYRIFLGLPESEHIDVLPDPPVFSEVDYEVNSAVEVALQNRLDLLNRQEQLEDVERGVGLARNGLLPDLDLRLGTSYATTSSISPPGGSAFERSDSSLSVTLGIPLDRVDQRNAYRSAELALGRARRSLEEFEDQLRVSIQSSFRELARRLESLEIQRQLIVDQTKNLRIAELRFERGDIDNRDVVEANQSLLDAKNALIDEQVGYEIARLQLLRDLGILFVDENGMWKR